MAIRNYKNNTSWWNEPDKHISVFSLAKQLEANDTFRKNGMLNYASMYSNINMSGLEPHSYSSYSTTGNRDRIKLNVVTAVVDTLCSKISKNKPKVVLLPSGADYSVARRAKKLEKFVAGIYDETDAHTLAAKVFLYSTVFGTGVIHPFPQDGNIELEVVLPHELLVDAQEAMYGAPRSMIRRKHVDRQVLASKFPKFRTAIESAGKIDEHIMSNALATISDMVTIVEAWHLPSAPGAKDGRHCVVVDGADLIDEPWVEDDFPFVFMTWQRPLLGFWGRGVVEEIAGIQIEINRTLIRIQEAHHALSNPLIFIDMASTISKAHMDSGIGTFVPYTGKSPTVQTFQTVHPEIYQHLNSLYQRAFEITGVSQQSSQSKNQLGPNASGTAIREMTDIESARFSLAAIGYERFFIKLAEKIINLARDLYTDAKTDKIVTVRGKKFIEKIAWKDVSLEDDQFSLDVGTASMLPESKAGRVQLATELLQAGAITQDQWKDLLQIPDIDAEADLEKAPRDYIKDVVEKILDEGVVIEPEKYDNLQFAIKYSVMSYQKAKLNNVPEDRLELLRRYIETLDQLLAPPEQPMGPAGPPGMPPEGASPAALPPGGNAPTMPGAPPAGQKIPMPLTAQQ